MIFVVCNEKGGAGKSSIAQSLVVWLAVDQKKDVLLVDSDPQRTSAEWAEERQETDLKAIRCVELHGNIAQDLVDLNERFGCVVVDCGGADSKAMRSALAVADLAVLPFRPKRRDLKVAPSMADVIETAQAMNNSLKVVSVITQAPTLPSQGYRIENAKNLLRSLNLNPLTHVTRNLNAWDDSEESGLSVLEYQEDSKAGDDARAIFCEIEETISKFEDEELATIVRSRLDDDEIEVSLDE